jgi:BRCT domain type II-containing protein
MNNIKRVLKISAFNKKTILPSKKKAERSLAKPSQSLTKSNYISL